MKFRGAAGGCCYFLLFTMHDVSPVRSPVTCNILRWTGSKETGRGRLLQQRLPLSTTNFFKRPANNRSTREHHRSEILKTESSFISEFAPSFIKFTSRNEFNYAINRRYRHKACQREGPAPSQFLSRRL